MSLRPDTIAIRNKPFVKRIMRVAKLRGAKTLSGVVQDLAEAELDRLSEGGDPAGIRPQHADAQDAKTDADNATNKSNRNRKPSAA